MGMTPESSDSNLAGQPEGRSASPSAGSRRRFIGATAGGVGVLLAVQARSALGQSSCQSISAMASGNLSHQADVPVCTAGSAPTDLKLQGNVKLWPRGAAPEFKSNVTLNDINELEYQNLISQRVTGSKNVSALISDPKDVMRNKSAYGTAVSVVLPGASLPGNTGIWEFLAFPQNFSGIPERELMRHLIAAWINTNLHPDYPIKPWHIQEMWESLRRGQPYCPSSLNCTDSMGLSTEEVISYIRTTYSSPTESSLLYVCKAT